MINKPENNRQYMDKIGVRISPYPETDRNNYADTTPTLRGGAHATL